MRSGIQGRQNVGFTVVGYVGGSLEKEGLVFLFKMEISGFGHRGLKGTKAGKEKQMWQKLWGAQGHPN